MCNKYILYHIRDLQSYFEDTYLFPGWKDLTISSWKDFHSERKKIWPLEKGLEA